jgi:hypothetical protein
MRGISNHLKKKNSDMNDESSELFFILLAEMISSFLSTCGDGCCIKIANSDYKKKKKK